MESMVTYTVETRIERKNSSWGRSVIMMAVVRRTVVGHTACVLGVIVGIHGSPAFLFGQ